MTRWLRRVRGAVGMGLTWAAGWAIAGVLIGASSLLLPGLPWNSFFAIFDAPLPALAIPGFVGGVLFSVVLGIAARRRSFHELSVPRFAAWGALGGLALSLVPAAFVAVGLADLGRPDAGLSRITATISVPFVLLSALSAAGSLVLARLGELRESGREATEPELEGEPRALRRGIADTHREHEVTSPDPARAARDA